MEDAKMSNDIFFHLQLLMNIIDINQYPFTKLVIEKKLTKSEYSQLFSLLKELDDIYHSQKEEGLLDYSSLLVHFVGMLNVKLSPTETIEALKQEGLFICIMTEFKNIIEKGGNNK